MDTWSRMRSWDLVLPPSRPDCWQLATIRRLIEGMDRTLPIAILGSTVEFRDQVCSLGFKSVYVFERNEEFYTIASRMRAFHSNEEVVWGDWMTTLPHLSGGFSVILSDLTSGNVPYELRSDFYFGIARALRPDGLFIDRILTHELPHIEVEQLQRKYREMPVNLLTVNHFSCEMLFCSSLLESGVVDSSAFYDQLNLKLEGATLRRFLELCPLVTPRDMIWWYGRPWCDLSCDYERHLETVDSEEEPSSSPYFRRSRLRVSRPRHWGECDHGES